MKILKNKVVTPVGFSVKKLSYLLGYSNYEKELWDPSLDSLKKKLGAYSKKSKSLGYLFALAYEKKVLNNSLRNKMIEYNRYDVIALRYIYQKVYSLLNGKDKGFVPIV